MKTEGQCCECGKPLYGTLEKLRGKCDECHTPAAKLPVGEEWGKEFDREFPTEFRRDNKDFIEISSYATTPERIKAFIAAEKAKSYEEGVAQTKREIVEKVQIEIDRIEGYKRAMPMTNSGFKEETLVGAANALMDVLSLLTPNTEGTPPDAV